MKKRIPQIEFLRVVAMVGVFFFHLWSVIPEAGTENPLGPLFGDILAQGYLGVVIFNTITGFVLTLPLAARGGVLDLPYAAFFRRRFGRICPQYYMALALWSAVALFTATAAGPSLGRCFFEHVAFVHTLDPACFYGIVPALWWMGLVAQFYLFYPLVLRLFVRIGPGWALGGIVIGCFGLWGLLEALSGWFPDGPFGLLAYMIYFNLPARLPEFATGMFLAFRWTARQAAEQAGADPDDPGASGFSRPASLALAGVTILAVALTVTVKDGLPAPAAHFLVCLCTLSISGMLFALPLIARLGESRAVARLAAASYSFYLIHQPLLGYAAEMLHGRMSPLAAFGVSAVVVGGLALAGAQLMDRAAAAFISRGAAQKAA
ncbi:acyltransferase family protein [Desulfolutivibrio sp.]|uniref:acyltransferase family protein n=1 Tax=Desulfolutivibrio sp. TaxID=2773296 RepID=UPI002F9627C4